MTVVRIGFTAAIGSVEEPFPNLYRNSYGHQCAGLMPLLLDRHTYLPITRVRGVWERWFSIKNNFFAC